MRKTDINDYGVGMVLYFQFMKYIGVIMLICSIIALPSIMINYYSHEPLSSSYNHQLAQLSIGNLGETHQVSTQLDFSSEGPLLELNCHIGIIRGVDSIG